MPQTAAPDTHLATLKKMTTRRSRGPGVALDAWRAGADRLLRDLFKVVFKLDVHVWELDGNRGPAARLLEEMPTIALPFLLERGESGVALLVLDGALIDGLIEQQLLGEVLATPRLDRPVTAIDAGLSEGFAKGVVQGLTRFLGPLPGAEALTGWQFKAAERDRGALRLAVPDLEYDVLNAVIDMGPGIKSGRFQFWVPAQEQIGRAEGLSAAQRDRLRSACQLALQAVMPGGRLSLSRLRGLAVDEFIDLDPACLRQVSLRDGQGRDCFGGTLGQLTGKRAVRPDMARRALSAAPPAEGVKAPEAEMLPPAHETSGTSAAPEPIPEAESETELEEDAASETEPAA